MSLRRVALAIALVLGLMAGMMGAATAAPSMPIFVNGPYTASLLAKAQPDECFNGVGNVYPPGPPCAQGQPKVNQAYVWGLTQAGSNLWFGTAPNVVCLVIGGYLGMTDPMQNDSYVCEFGQSQVAQTMHLPAMIGDWRPPKIYTYNTVTGALVDKSALAGALLQTTMGLRSAGSLNGVVFLAGPSLSLSGGVNMFAFNATTGALIGAQTMPGYDNVRKWIVDQGVLYTSMHKTGGGGSILRWTGNVGSPFSFDTVGSIKGDGAELAVYQGNMFVSTWPDTTAIAGLWMSPAIPAGGLTTAQATGWTKVWDFSQYEPDPITAATYGGGALISFGGYLYWGTMHVPLTAALAHLQKYPTSSTAGMLTTIQNTQRAISIFRGQNFASGTPKVQVLYGEATLPVQTGPNSWVQSPNKTGTPLYGKSGFGNQFNNYTWTMSVYKNQLFIGTMDWSYLFPDFVNGFASEMLGTSTNLVPRGVSLLMGAGADLWRFPNASSPATAVNTNGMGNPTSYGIRTMLVSQDTNTLYLGMANPMNLLTKPSQPYHGGWELLQLKQNYVWSPWGSFGY
ncbi:MAG TPA: hypothetical protein VMU89_16460 [Thermomicrobiaceae bacterium]|nr:hypothetical protein [Thermomicrobiaceae bacterium]